MITFFDIFIISYSIVHLHLQYRYWIKKEENIFAKYCKKEKSYSYTYISKWVYFTKATWMISFVLLQYIGYSFHFSLVHTFVFYSIELLILFPPKNIYNCANFILSILCLIEYYKII